jgi:ABC-type ATPase involved in cell division
MEPDEVSRRHRIGIAFQDHGLLPWLSTRANVALPFRLAGQSTDDA